ncbi:MAG: CCA tRNA nucleotidyltransferase [Planctomycetota bacterium]
MPMTERSAAIEIIKTLREKGHEALLAGGCVRDELLGLEPKDFDVVTSAMPDEVGRLFKEAWEVGKAFAVMQVRVGGHWIEVATYRSDGEYSDRRRPDKVEFADGPSDARRRDFTVNALFLDPLDEEAGPIGRVVDHVGGVADLEKRILRAVGDPKDRLGEDHLRALRAVRFASRLGFEIEEHTAQAIRLHSSELSGVSRERVGEEMKKMMGHPGRVRAAMLMQQLGLDAPALGEVTMPEAPLRAMELLSDDSASAEALAAWAYGRHGHDPGKSGDVVAGWRASLCLSNDDTQTMSRVLELIGVMDAGQWEEACVATRKRLARSVGFESAVRIVSGHAPNVSAEVRLDVESLISDGIGLQPVVLLDGNDLINMGLRPGPKFGRYLGALETEQLEGRVRTIQEAQELIKKLDVPAADQE